MLQGAGLGLEVRDEKDEKKEEEIMGNEGKIKRKKILEPKTVSRSSIHEEEEDPEHKNHFKAWASTGSVGWSSSKRNIDKRNAPMIIRNTYDDSNRSGDSSSVDPTTSFDAFKCKEAILRGEEIHFAELDGNSPTFGRLKCLPAWQRQQVPAKYLLHPLNCDIQGKKS
ncbi:unnamed protein product, partial [Onchocerca flexuosa]|uniref:Uncharacterized protein n=1 Tax=Onchocerca flexuosa TaxID=387005 RepID=A0A183I115_9BILA